MHMSPRQYVIWFVRVCASLILLFTALQLWLDPFWAWRRTPPWLAWHGGHNWNLDIRMRSAKPLQLLTRDSNTILIGSSRTYHGFDVSHMDSTYNLGISGLRMRELEAYVRYALMHTDVERLVIGLDYFMFDARHPTVAGFNPSLTRPRYLFDAVPAALYSADAISGARYAIKGNKAREGVWDYFGHKALTPIGPEKIPAMLEAERENLGRVVHDAGAYASLRRTLLFAQSQHIEVVLYLSPVHPVQRSLLANDNAESRFSTWRHDVARIASDHGIACHDLIDMRFGDEDALMTQGTTRFWQDVTHFTPEAGKYILDTVLK